MLSNLEIRPTASSNFGCQRTFLNPIISKFDKHVVLLLINYIASEEIQLRNENYGAVSDKKQTEILNQRSEIRMFTELT